MEGMISEKKEAASMTPAANPNAKSRTLRFGVLVNKTGSAPTAVIKPAARLANTPHGDGRNLFHTDYLCCDR